jgi:hypothetical protein
MKTGSPGSGLLVDGEYTRLDRAVAGQPSPG